MLLQLPLSQAMSRSNGLMTDNSTQASQSKLKSDQYCACADQLACSQFVNAARLLSAASNLHGLSQEGCETDLKSLDLVPQQANTCSKCGGSSSSKTQNKAAAEKQ